MNALSVSKIDKAYKVLKNLIIETPLITNDKINNLYDAKVYFKLENLQKTGSFKIRGATYKLSLLSKTQKKKGVVAYSSGNHGQAVAFAAKQLGIDATIIMPQNAPNIKKLNTKKLGAKVILYDPKKQIREKIGNEISKKKGKILIKPYDDIDIISGQGTLGKEIVNSLNKIKIIPDIYLCCVSGGGLIAGSATYLKNYYPKIKCYSVEPNGFNDTLLSLKKNRIISNKNNSSSICDALLVPKPGDITFSINKKILTKGLSVSDLQVKKTIKYLSEELKLKVEPGGAVAAASILSRKINIKQKKVVVVLSGGNIDYEIFRKIIKKNYD
tara:strand:- start:1615 stop:2598 length:984 start_codon:yes stop_codon:yes gene_type:complete